jgi:hypothetical protein
VAKNKFFSFLLSSMKTYWMLFVTEAMRIEILKSVNLLALKKKMIYLVEVVF